MSDAKQHFTSDADKHKQDGIAFYKSHDLSAALSSFSAAAAADPSRADIAANISATLLELGRYPAAVTASAEALSKARAAGDSRRAEICAARQKKAESLAALAEAYTSARTRPGPEALPPPVRPPSAEGFTFYPLGLEQPTSFLTDRSALPDQLSGPRSIAALQPLWLEADGARPDFAVLVAASSDARHVVASLGHLKALSSLASAKRPASPYNLRIHTNDIVAQVVARQVLFFALLLEPPIQVRRDADWRYGVADADATASAFPPVVSHFCMAYAFLAAHNLFRVQWSLFSAALDRNIAAAQTAETWHAAYEGGLAMDDATRVAVREEWRKWREEKKLSNVLHRWQDRVILGGKNGIGGGGLDSMLGGVMRDAVASMVAELGGGDNDDEEYDEEDDEEDKPQWMSPERCLNTLLTHGADGELRPEGEPHSQTHGPGRKSALAKQVLSAVEDSMSEGVVAEVLEGKLALAASLKAGEDSDYDAWTEEEIRALFVEHVPGFWIVGGTQQAFKHIPRIRAEAEFCERTGCILPVAGVETFPHDVTTASKEELNEMFFFNPSFGSPSWLYAADVEPTSLDPFAFIAGEFIYDSEKGTVAWIAFEKLRSMSAVLGATILIVGNKRRSVTVELSFSVGDMLEVFSRTPPASLDRILVSNVPDYIGWGPVFTLASPLLKRTPQSVITGDCLKNPPVFSSFEALFEATTIVPFSWTAERHGLSLVWGSNPLEDTVAIGATSNIANGMRSASEGFSEIARLLVRSLYTKGPQKVDSPGGFAAAMEIVSSSSSALALWAVVAHDEIPLHIVRDWLADVMESGIAVLDCAEPRLRAEAAPAFLSKPARRVTVAPILADFAYAASLMFGGAASPLSGVMPTAFEALQLQKNSGSDEAWCRQRHDDPTLQVCLLLSLEGQTVSKKGDDLLTGEDLETGVKKGVDAAVRCADLVFHVWTSSFKVHWKKTNPAFFGRIELELNVPVGLAGKVRSVGADARWFGLSAVDHGHVQKLELV